MIKVPVNLDKYSYYVRQRRWQGKSVRLPAGGHLLLFFV